MHKIKLCISLINNYFNKKDMLLILLLAILGCGIPTISGNPNLNFFSKFYEILNDRTFNFFMFLSLMINVFIYLHQLSNSQIFIMRLSNYNLIIKAFLKNISIYTIYIYIINIVLAMAGSILVSLNGFSMIYHPNYNFPIYLYLLFFIIRNAIILVLVFRIFFLVVLRFDNIITKLLILFFNILFLLPLKLSKINYFYEGRLLFNYYFLNINYQSFYLEVLCSILQILLLIIIQKMMTKYLFKKKRDLL